MKRSKWFALVAMLAALSMVAAACGGGEEEDGPTGAEDGNEPECTWVVGTIGALSGDFASVGKPIYNGFEYAVEEANEKGDLPCTIEIQAEDSQGNPDQAPPLAQSLVENEDLIAIVGPYFSGESLATGDIYSDAGVAWVTPSATNETIDDQGYTTFFRAVANDADQGPTAANYIKSALKPGTVAVVHDNQDYSKGLADTVKKELGGVAEGPFIINPEEVDYSAVVSQVQETDPDVVYYGGYAPQAGPLAKQLGEAGVEAIFVSDDGTKDPSFGDLAGKHAEGALVTCPCVDPLKVPAAETFVQGMQEKYGEPPGTFAADAYDAANLIFNAIRDLNGDEAVEDVRATVVEYLQGAQAVEGITKTYTFGDNGEVEVDPLRDVWIYEWSNQDGTFVSLGPAEDLL